MADDTKPGMAALDRFGRMVDDLVPTDPEAARRWLLRAFRAEGLRTRLLPHRELLPSGRLDNRNVCEGVADALSHPDRCVFSSIFMPNEIFLALGAKPLLAEAVGDFFSGARAEEAFVTAAEEASIPETYCSYHKVLVGAGASGVIAAPRMIASCSVACDANNLTFRWLARRLGVPACYVDVPYDPSEQAVVYVADQLREVARTAGNCFGTTLDEGVLREHVSRSLRALQIQEDSLARRRGRYLANTMSIEMMRVCSLHMLLGGEKTDELMTQYDRDLEALLPYEGLNLVWAHCLPYFSVPLQKVLDHSDVAQVIASDMAFDQHRVGGFRFGADTPYESMAERLVYNSFNGPATRRAERILELARATDADGVVVFCHWGCKETAGAAQLIRSTVEAAGYPVLVLDGDGCHRRNMPDGQAATRMGAYLEMLRGRRA